MVPVLIWWKARLHDDLNISDLNSSLILDHWWLLAVTLLAECKIRVQNTSHCVHLHISITVILSRVLFSLLRISSTLPVNLLMQLQKHSACGQRLSHNNRLKVKVMSCWNKKDFLLSDLCCGHVTVLSVSRAELEFNSKIMFITK